MTRTDTAPIHACNPSAGTPAGLPHLCRTAGFAQPPAEPYQRVQQIVPVARVALTPSFDLTSSAARGTAGESSPVPSLRMRNLFILLTRVVRLNPSRAADHPADRFERPEDQSALRITQCAEHRGARPAPAREARRQLSCCPRAVTRCATGPVFPSVRREFTIGSPAALSSRGTVACKTTLAPWRYVLPDRSTAPARRLPNPIHERCHERWPRRRKP